MTSHPGRFTLAVPYDMSSQYRSHTCDQLRATDAGTTATLAGWVDANRDHHGVIFIDLRDRYGITQVVFRPEESAAAAELAHQLRREDVVQVRGRVSTRLPGTENAKLASGAVELVADELTILNKADVPPFPLDSESGNEDLRLTYRYLDMRRARLARNLQLRHRIAKTTRDYLDAAGYLEIETPILSNSTPEGARSFLVPSRLVPGTFYALPQAPQQYKQLLMVAGMDKYFQIAKCFRDEDLRADRQPEFTQIDIEASFVVPEDIYALVEGLLAAVFKVARGVDIPLPFPRLTYEEAMSRFGSDKPDTRFGMELTDLGDTFAKSQFKVFAGALAAGGVVKAINAKKFAVITTGQIEELTKMAQSYGAKGLAFIKVENGEWKSPIVKFFSPEERAALTDKLGIEEGDLILFGADKKETVCEVLGRIRLRVAEILKLATDPDQLNFLWVVEFPLLAFNAEDNKWDAVHHPFTRPVDADRALLDAGEFAKVRAQTYDVVLNGVELGGGSIRIHEPDLQARVFEILGVNAAQQQLLFGHILKAFRFGAPPHGGLAFGFDRLVMLACGEENIREVMAFPKNNRGQDLMSQSPTEVDFKQLRELYLQSTAGQKKDAPKPAASPAQEK